MDGKQNLGTLFRKFGVLCRGDIATQWHAGMEGRILTLEGMRPSDITFFDKLFTSQHRLVCFGGSSQQPLGVERHYAGTHNNTTLVQRHSLTVPEHSSSKSHLKPFARAATQMRDMA
eukprot:4829323-Amphidinium_carterae.1